MKQRVSVFWVLLCLSVSCTSKQTNLDVKDQIVKIDSGAEDVKIHISADSLTVLDEKIKFIKSFYFEYITETCTEDGSLPNMKNVERIEEKYCSKELLEKIKGLDYDPFLKAQDCDVEWLNILDIKADKEDDTWFIVSYSYVDYLGVKQNICIKLKIIQTDNYYLIIDLK